MELFSAETSEQYNKTIKRQYTINNKTNDEPKYICQYHILNTLSKGNAAKTLVQLVIQKQHLKILKFETKTVVPIDNEKALFIRDGKPTLNKQEQSWNLSLFK